MIFHRQDIGTFAKDANMPAIFGWKRFVEAGGLLSYGPNLRESLARLAFFVDKILKGTKPNDLPVEIQSDCCAKNIYPDGSTVCAALVSRETILFTAGHKGDRHGTDSHQPHCGSPW